MKDITIKNKTLITILDKNKWFMEDYVLDHVNTRGDKNLREKYLSEEYLKEIIGMWDKHEGFPEESYSIGFSKLKDMRFKPNEKNKILKLSRDIVKKYTENTDELQQKYMLKSNALFTVYPPGGYISWHNNANASAYNVIFTWSETGDGWFKWVDPKTNIIHTVEDVPGWQCKVGYFGRYSDGEDKLIYHSASTECYRMSVAFTLDRSETSYEAQSWLIEDIMSEE